MVSKMNEGYSYLHIRLVHCIGSSCVIPLVNKIMTVFGIVIGLLMFTRGLLDGRLSMIGLWLRLLYFGVTSGSYALDARLKADRWSFLTPALSGLILTIAQLLGMFVVDGPFECSDLQSCL